MCVKKPMDDNIGFLFAFNTKSHLYEKVIDKTIMQLYSCYKGIWRENKC